MDLNQVRMSLVDGRKNVFARFEGKTPEELSTYFLEGMSSSPFYILPASLINLQHLINYYVTRRSPEFQEEYKWHLMGKIRPNEVKETDLGIHYHWDIGSIIAKVREESEIHPLREDVRPYGKEGQITGREFKNSRRYAFVLENPNPLGFRDEFGYEGLAKKVSAEQIRVAKKMAWKGLRSARKG